MEFPGFPNRFFVMLGALAMFGAQSAPAQDKAEFHCSVSTIAAAGIKAAPSSLERMRMEQEAASTPHAPGKFAANAVTATARPSCSPASKRQITSLAAGQVPAPTQNMPAPDSPHIFGSTALPISHTPLDAKWRAASRAKLPPLSGRWRSLMHEISDRSRAEQARIVNISVNAHIKFDDDGYDQWSAAGETLRRGAGDCEDYAIAKMKLLEAAGFPRSHMYLVIADDLVRRVDHAMLVVRLGQNLLVLDNATDELLDAHNLSDYRPVFSYGERGAWLHGYAAETN